MPFILIGFMGEREERCNGFIGGERRDALDPRWVHGGERRDVMHSLGREREEMPLILIGFRGERRDLIGSCRRERNEKCDGFM